MSRENWECNSIFICLFCLRRNVSLDTQPYCLTSLCRIFISPWKIGGSLRFNQLIFKGKIIMYLPANWPLEGVLVGNLVISCWVHYLKLPWARALVHVMLIDGCEIRLRLLWCYLDFQVWLLEVALGKSFRVSVYVRVEK